MAHKIKTEHAGAKKGGSGFYGHHSEAKEVCKTKRRIADKQTVRQEVSRLNPNCDFVSITGDEAEKVKVKRLVPRDFLAIPFGDDGVGGDSYFYPTKDLDDNAGPIFSSARSTFAQIQEEYRERFVRNNEYEPGPDELPAGYWILTQANFDTAMIPDKAAWPNGDTGQYIVNRIVKSLCNHLATRVVGDKSVLKVVGDKSALKGKA